MNPKSLVAALLALGESQLGFAQSPYPITGVSVESGADVPLRRNIQDLQATAGPQWDLYILSLSEMQQGNDTDPLSYFQIAGIHGQPYIEWNDTGREQADGWQGYCPHGEELFATWHRPYVLLFEQVLVSHAKRIAQTYPQQYRQRYMEAAEGLRSPYWDWAANSTVPSISVPQKVLITVPNGQALEFREIDNPFFTYKFPPSVLAGQFGTFDDRPEVLRCVAPLSYPASANQRLLAGSYKTSLYDLFSRATTYKGFTLGNRFSVSLEMLHNSIHVNTACGQQFADLDYAAFDPLFMLHHSNVDRIWAYWQAIRPDQDIFNDRYSGMSRFGTPSGTSITTKSPLQPFFGLNGVPHTSESVRSMKGFGYSYEGLEYWYKSPTQMKQDAISLINRLYSTRAEKQTRRQELQPVRRYFARISLDRAQVFRPSRLTVHINGTEAARLEILEHPAIGNLTAGIALDHVLQTIPQASASDEAAASIASALTVRISKPDGSSAGNVTGLQTILEAVTMTPPSTENQFPEFGTPEFWYVGSTPRKLSGNF